MTGVDCMIWYARDVDGIKYTLGDYGDVVAAAEAAADYVNAEVVKIWAEVVI